VISSSLPWAVCWEEGRDASDMGPVSPVFVYGCLFVYFYMSGHVHVHVCMCVCLRDCMRVRVHVRAHVLA